MTHRLDTLAPERRYRCLVEDYDGGRHIVTVSAIGPIGAKETARQTARDRDIDIIAVLTVEEVAA